MKSLKEAQELDGVAVVISLSGTHVLDGPMHFDSSVLASEVSIVGAEGAVISLPSAAGERRRMSAYTGTTQAALILGNYNQKVQVKGVVFQGGASSIGTAAVLVESGELIMNNCTVRGVQGTRALHANGGHSTIRNSTFEANQGGAIAATSGKLFIWDSALVRNGERNGAMAEYGGALAVKGNQTDVTVVATRIEHNYARLQGGGLHVAEGARVALAIRTVLEENSAPKGAAMQLSGGITYYVLPAPPGRWVNTAKRVPSAAWMKMYPRKALVSELVLGSHDEDYPLACPPGSVGDDEDRQTQVSPVCVGACPAGSLCPSATHTPQRIPASNHPEPHIVWPQHSAHLSHTHSRVCRTACTEGTYCPPGSAAGTFCPPGTFTFRTNLTSPAECEVCPAGYYCMSGSKNNCGKSTYNPHLETSLQTACLQCPANSVTNDTAATSPQHCTCIAGYYNMRLANETVECCQCPVGSNCAAEGITLATLPLITGYYRSSNSSSDLRRCLDFGESSGCVGGASDGEGPCKLGLEAPPQHNTRHMHACILPP